MKPNLIVEGKRYNIAQMGFNDEGQVTDATIFKDGVCTLYYDAKTASHYIESQKLLNFSEAFSWEGQFDEVITAIEKRIEAHEERVIEISQEFIKIYADGEVPFLEVEAKKLQQEYKEIQLVLNGLYEAKKIIFDLEGGEINEQ